MSPTFEIENRTTGLQGDRRQLEIRCPECGKWIHAGAFLTQKKCPVCGSEYMFIMEKQGGTE